MPLSPNFSLRIRVVLILLAAYLILAGAMIWQALAQRDVHLAAATDKLSVQVQLAAARQQVLIERGDAILNGLIQSQQLSVATGEACASELAERHREEPAFLQIGKVAPNGDALCVAMPGQNRVNWADRAWFQQALNAQNMVISAVTIGRILGQPVITLARAQRNDSGQVQAVYFLSFTLEWLEQSLISGNTPAGARVVVIDNGGKVVLRHPDAEALTGSSLAEHPMVKRLLAEGREGTAATNGTDGSARIVAYTPLLKAASGERYFLWLSQDQSQVLSPAQSQLLSNLLVALAILGLTVALVFWGSNRYLLVPLLRLARAAGRLVDVDATEPANTAEVPEIAAVTEAFDAASRLLAQQRVALQAANANLLDIKTELLEAQHLAAIGHWSWEIEGDVHRWSATIYDIYGRDPQLPPAIYPEVQQYFTEASWAGLAAAVTRCRTEGKPYACDAEVVRPDGSRRWITARGQARRDAAGQIVALHGTVQDITARRQEENILRDSEARLAHALTATQEGVWDFDMRSGLVTHNRHWCEMLGLSDDYLAHPIEFFFERLHPDDRDLVQSRVAAAIEGEGRYSAEYSLRHHDGHYLRVSDQGKVAERDTEGKPVRLIGAFADVTRRWQAEMELHRLNANLEQRVAAATREIEVLNWDLQAKAAEAVRANNAKSRFLAAASHDLRQPLSAISVYTGLLKSTPRPSDQKIVANMQECVSSLSALLNDLLDLSKLEAGVITPTTSDFSIAELFDSIQSLHRPEALAKGLRLRCRPSPLTGRTDAVLFRRLLSNLLENALRYTERGGVLIGCRRRQGKTWIEVWDTGVGIPADRTVEIFEEFNQLGDGARNQGSGLGLAIVAKTATLLGLDISLRSWPGRGSVFAIELPLGESERVMPARPLHTPTPQHLRIAFVEDNLLVRDAMVVGLQGLGHQVVASATQAALLAELEQFAPDIVVSDYRLTQGETGIEVIAAARAKLGTELPAILLTGDTDPNLLRSMSDRGIVVLHKPVDLEILQDCLEDLTYQRA